jgi:hypothetical protein
MKKSVGVLAAMVLGWTVNSALAQVDFVPRAKPKAPAKVGMTDKEFNAFTAALEKNAESWLSGEIADHAVLYQITQLNLQRAFSVGQITYDKSTIPLVKAYIDSSTKLKDPQRLYVLVKLLGAFVTAKPEVILEALPMVRDLEKKYHNAYKVYPSYGPAALKQFEIP